jgi:hypothetical protein
MLPENRNSIGNLSFQLQYNGNIDGIEIKKTTENIVEHRFLPALEKLLDRHSPPHTVISIDHIDCDISISDGDINEALSEKIMQQLEKQLLEEFVLFGQNAKPPTIEMRFAETLLYYLENGYMPWWAAITSKQQLNESIIRLAESEIKGDVFNALILLLKRDTVIARICNDFEDTTFWAFFKLLPGYKNNTIITAWQKDYLTFITDKKLSAHKNLFSFLYKKNLLKSIAPYKAEQLRYNLADVNKQFIRLFTVDTRHGFSLFSKYFTADAVKLISKIKNEYLKTGLTLINRQNEEILKEAAEKKVQKHEQANENIEKTDPAEPVYTNNSGLVIIAPYLGMFFKKAGVIEDDKIINATKAITLLHYIATGTGTFAEFEIVLPKLLCGLDLKSALTSPYTITQTDIELVNELLNSVIGNWSVLKNTSIDGLRGTFLLREGKLTFKDNGSYLKVQQNAVDVLLEHLPWNINMVKLPWMKNILYVDWV